MTLLVRDEMDILDENITFHRAMGIDHFIITDNRSLDATPEIIARYVAMGIATAITETSDDYDQTAWVTRMARMAFDRGADWVVHSDADEFWMPRSGTLRDVLTVIPGNVAGILAPRHDFAALRMLDADWHQAMVYRKTVSINHIGRPLPPKVAHRASGSATVHQGNHAVSGLDGAVVGTEDVEILHFPVRSQSQFENKIRNGGAAYGRNTKIAKTVGMGWRRLYAELAEKGSLDDYLSGLQFDGTAIDAGLADGSLRIDRRLADFFARVSSGS